MKKKYSVHDINDFRNYYAVLSNDFARNSCHSYTLHAHRILCYILAKIPSYDGYVSNRTDIEIDLGHVIAVFNLPSSGVTYKKFRDALEELLCSPILQNDPFLDKCIQTGKTVYRVTINRNLEKHFFELGSDYVQFPILNVICFRSEYSFQIYASLLSRFRHAEYIRKKTAGSSRGFIESFSYSPDDILKMFSLTQPSYGNYKCLNSAVLKKTCIEINKYTDIVISYDGNSREIRYTIRNKTSDESMKSYIAVLEILNSACTS